MKTKEIIGYKLKDEKYRKAALKLIPDSLHLQGENPFIKKLAATVDEFERIGVLDLWFEPVYKEEPELNRWYKDKDKFGEGMIFFANEITEDEDVLGYGIAQDEWCECGIWGEADNFTAVPATDAEVEKALIQEATKRGFKEGVRINSVECLGLHCRKDTPVENLEYDSDNNIITVDYGVVFNNGQWAEIIEQTHEVIFPKHLEGKLTIKYQ